MKRKIHKTSRRKATTRPHKPRLVVPIWTTKDGREIPVTAMTDSHLANTIAMLERKAPLVALSTAMSMSPFMDSMGDGAQMTMESELDALADHSDDPAYFWPIYDDLVDEQDRRARAGVRVTEETAP